MQHLVLVITVANRGYGERFAEEYRALNIPISLISLGKGTASNEMLDLLGLGESEKDILFSITDERRAKAMLARLDRRERRRAGNNIAFSVPLKSIGSLTLSTLLGGDAKPKEVMENREEENSVDNIPKYELIVVVTGRGYVDLVMDAARKENASGGTVIHARGTGTAETEKFFGVSVSADKEMIFIVVKCENKADVMRSIMAEAGLHTKAKSLIFSVPVKDIAGLTLDPPAEDFDLGE